MSVEVKLYQDRSVYWFDLPWVDRVVLAWAVIARREIHLIGDLKVVNDLKSEAALNQDTPK